MCIRTAGAEGGVSITNVNGRYYWRAITGSGTVRSAGEGMELVL